MSEYRCSICESFLTVNPDPIHTGGMIVEPCQTCRERLEWAVYEKEDQL